MSNFIRVASIIVLNILFSVSLLYAQPHKDSTLVQVIAKDQVNRSADGTLQLLSANEHSFRADVYMSNRKFPQARKHWKKIIENYPQNMLIPKALFGMGRSNMWERRYETAVFWFDVLIRDHVETFHGREGLAYKGACYVRLGKNIEAAKTYEQYTIMFPFGKRIASSLLNIIDAYREEAEYEKANLWVDKTRHRFTNTKTEMNALHARLRMEVFRKNWRAVISAANELIRIAKFNGSMAYEHEVLYLKAYSLERLGKKEDALETYSSIPVKPTSYFSGLATDKIAALGGDAAYRKKRFKASIKRIANNYPIRYRFELLKYSKLRGIDPRFLLAIMKQESGFSKRAKSPAAARGLLQLTYDTALKYSRRSGFHRIKSADLYRPNVNIAIGSFYIAKLEKEFGGLYEAVAASYNGGEDNSARWLKRSRPKNPAIFISEIGFSETKKYVLKVMNNYRIYKELYNKKLSRR